MAHNHSLSCHHKNYKTVSDAELADLLKASDHAAYKEIYERYHYLMLVHAYKKLRDEDLAKDMIQDLFTNLWIKREQVLSTGNLAPFLYKSLKNQIINYIVHQGVRSKYITSISDYLSNGHNAYTDHPIREKELQAYIDKEILALPQKMRNVFELSLKQRLSNKEIAVALNTSESNVSHHIKNAITMLRIKLRAIIKVAFF